MLFELKLNSLPPPRLTVGILERPLATLKEIADRNNTRSEPGRESIHFKNRKEELIRLLKNRTANGRSFEQATSVVGRERLLLSLYLEYLGRPDAKEWLPRFDQNIALSILGKSGAQWHGGRRRQVALLFFTHFDRLLPALPFLCARLVEAYSRPESIPWHEHRKVLFHITAGPVNVAVKIQHAEKLEQLMARFAIPDKGRFAEKLRQIVLLDEIRKISFGEVSPVFEQIEVLKGERVSDTLLMGSAALQIMVKRVIEEGGQQWPGDWPEWITRFGCDPRYGRSSAVSSKWWGWATDSEYRLAQQGVTGLTLEFFINFLRESLDGTRTADQFDLRSQFLLALFKAGKIQNARLLLNQSSLRQFPLQHRNIWNVAKLTRTTDQTSMICLRCTDDIYIIEGTHSFGLRMFYREFPVDGFWDHPEKKYLDSDLRISPAYCPVFLRHDPSGNWFNKFFHELRVKFHVEWQ